MIKRKRLLLCPFFALVLVLSSSPITSNAVNVTKNYGIYSGVVSLTRYTENGVNKVKNGSPVKCVIRLPYSAWQTYNAVYKSVILASNKQSYTLDTRGTQIDLGDSKPYWVDVDIAGFK